MAESNAPRIDSTRKQEVYERMYAYYHGIIRGARFVKGGQIEELKAKIKEEEVRCQEEANEVACWAARGLKQIQSCQDLKTELKRVEDAHRALGLRATKRDERIFLSLIEIAYVRGRNDVTNACNGYVESAQAFMGMVLNPE